jgi:signal transduction histidine kinase
MACLLPLALVAWFFLDRSNQRNTEQITNNEQTIVDIVNRSLTTYLSDTMTALDNLGQLDPIEEAIVNYGNDDADALLAQARLVRKDLNGLFIVNDKLTQISNSGTEPVGQVLQSLQGQIDQTINGDQPTISGRLTLEDGTSVIVLMVPVTTGVEATTSFEPGTVTTALDRSTASLLQADPDPGTEVTTKSPGQNIGAIGAIIQTTNLEQRVIPFPTGNTEIAITNGTDILVGTSGIIEDQEDFLTRQGPIINRALNGGFDNLTMTDGDGTERIAVFAPVQFENINWAIFVSSPTPREYTWSLYMQGAIVLTLAATIILALAVVFGELTARPVRTLARKADALQRGDFSTDLEPVGSGEIRVLSQAFADMAKQLKAQFNGLERSRYEREHQTVQMRDLLRRTLRLQEDERRRIAGEIHDAVSPLITGALYQARALLMTNGKTPPEEREQSLSNVNNLLEKASDELHGVIFDLRPPDLDDLGVVAAIEAYVQTIKQTGLNCRLEVENEPTDLSSDIRLGIYRIVQEALHNVVRHSGADEAVVRLETVDNYVRVTIRDNGSGFDPEKAVRPTSLGLLSMKERADAIGATFQIVSRPGGGTAIIIERLNSGNVMSDDVLATLMAELQPELAGQSVESLAAGDESNGKPES